MNVEIVARPSYSMAYLRLAHNESAVCEAGSMVALSSGMEAHAELTGGLAASILRRYLVNEPLFFARYQAHIENAWVAVSPRFPGDVHAIELHDGEELHVEAGALLAHSQGINSGVRFAGTQSILMREGAIVVGLSGEGTAVLGVYGAFQQFRLGEGEQLIVDTGHLVAWSPTLSFKVGPLTGPLSAQFTGEGMVAELTGPGQVLISTRSPQSFRGWLSSPTSPQNSGRS